MKKNIILIIIMIFMLGLKNVSAKDTIHSVKKYQDANLLWMENSYDINNKMDGFLTIGTYLEENEENKNYQVIAIKYKKNGKIAWTYQYGNSVDYEALGIDYTYNEDGNRDGYLLVVKTTYDAEEVPETNSSTTFIKLDLEGNVVWEKSVPEKVIKILPTYNDNTEVTGFIAITSTIDEKAMIIQYDKELNKIWQKEDLEDHLIYEDITTIQEDTKIIGYVILRNNEAEGTLDLLKTDLEGNKVSLQEIDPSYENLSLQRSENGFILYGITKEVKLKKGDISYFVLNYDKDGSILFESIGNEVVDEKEKVLLQPLNKGYVVLYKNKIDSSYEVVKLDEYGIILKKIKKIKNNYYDFNDFHIIKDTIYFVGQINCPEKDNCDYKNNSLFLVSDEETVIEVKDNDSKKILIGITLLMAVLVLGAIFSRKKKRV